MTLDSHTDTVTSHAFAYSSRLHRKPRQGVYSLEERLKISSVAKFESLFKTNENLASQSRGILQKFVLYGDLRASTLVPTSIQTSVKFLYFVEQ